MAIFEYPEFFLIIPLVVYLFYLLSRIGKSRSEPTNWPLVGMLPTALRKLHCGHDYITQVLSECGGTFVFKGPWFCNADMVFTSDPANIHHVLSRNFSNYPKGPEFRMIFKIFGDGVFGSDFELWEIHRKTTLSHLTHANFSRSLETAVWSKVEKGLFKVLDHFCKRGSDFDLQDIFQRFTFDVICKVVLDYDPCSLSIELPYVPCEKAFSKATQPLLHRHVIPERIWKLQNWLNIGGEKRLMEAWKELDEFTYPLVNLKNDNANLLKAYRKVYKEENVTSRGGLSAFLRDTSVSLMFAGRDTTSTCLTWLFWLISQNPSTEIKIREEIETELHLNKEGKKWRFFNVQDSRKLVYLHGALFESLRLFPPGAFEHKAPLRPDILPSGHYIRENTKLILCVYSMGRMESVWGNDCLEFKPERWISPSGGLKHVPSYKFPAFNAGPRTCLGKDTALIQMKMVAATIIYHYNIKLVEGHPVYPRDAVVIQAKHGLKVRLSKRNV